MFLAHLYILFLEQKNIIPFDNLKNVCATFYKKKLIKQSVSATLKKRCALFFKKVAIILPLEKYTT